MIWKNQKTEPTQKKQKPELAPDGVPIDVAWSRFPVGASIFVPCMNTTKAKHQIKRAGQRRLMRFDMRIRIENGKYGVRAWRIV